MTRNAGTRAASRILSRQVWVVLFVFLSASVSREVAAATYWQVQQPGITAFVQGDKVTAQQVAATAGRLQSAARFLFNWPETHREPPAVIFAVDESVLRGKFKFPAVTASAYTDDYSSNHEVWARTPSLLIVAAPLEPRKGEEFRSLQHAYSEVLLRAEPTHDWPPCVQIGMSLLLAAADLTPPNHFLVSGEKLRGPFVGARDILNPEKLLTPTKTLQGGMPQWELDQNAYSCLRLSFMLASANPEQRSAMERMLTEVGHGTPLSEATMSELHQTLPQFTARYREFNPYQDIQLDFPDEIAMSSEPTPMKPEEVDQLLTKICSRLSNCRK